MQRKLLAMFGALLSWPINNQIPEVTGVLALLYYLLSEKIQIKPELMIQEEKYAVWLLPNHC